MNLIPKNLSQLRRIALAVLLASFAILDTTSISAQELGRTITSPFGVANPYMNASDASESGSNGDTFVDPETGEVGHIIRNPFGVANPEGVDTGIDIPENAGEEVGGIITSPFGVPASDDIDTGVDVFEEDEEYLISLPDDEESEVEESEDVDEVDDETSDDEKELEGESAETTTEKFVPVVDNPTRGGEYPSNDFYIEGRCGNLVVTSETDLNGAVPTLYVPDNSSCLISAEIQGNIPSGNPQWFIKTSNSTLISLPDQTGSHRYIFQATPNTYGRTYTVLCRISGGTIQERAINISIYKVEGLKVYDPKLEDAGSAQYTLTGSGISKFVVENSSGTIVDTLSVTNDGHFSWNGRWGKNPDESEINTNYTGKFADPGKYTLHIVYPTSSNANNISPIESYAIYVVRLGVTEIEFQGVNPDEYFPLQFQATDFSELGLSESELLQGGFDENMQRNRFPLPQEAWRIGDEESNGENADITQGADAGNRQNLIEPYVDYEHDKLTIFIPLAERMPNGSYTTENDTWNYPVCYKRGSKLQIRAKTSPRACSQARGINENKILNYNELGFNEPGRPTIRIKAYVKREEQEATEMIPICNPTQNQSTLIPAMDITSNMDVFFQDNVPSVMNYVGNQNIILEYHWQYLGNNNEYIDVPGKMETIHKVYSIIDSPKGPWIGRPLWISVLHYATTWATGCNTYSEVANSLTTTINKNLGLEYEDEGRCMFSFPGFVYSGGIIPCLYQYNCDKFTRYLLDYNSPAFFSSQIVRNDLNCSDCALAVVVFSNILGNNLKVAHIYEPHALNQIKPIGKEFFQNEGAFSYHAFATNYANHVWDACLEIANDPMKSLSESCAVLPQDMPFNNSLTNRNPLDVLPLCDPLSSATLPTLENITNSSANGQLEIMELYEHDNNDGVIPDQLTLICTSAFGNNYTFTWICDWDNNADPNVITLPPSVSSKEEVFLVNDIAIFKYKLTKGTNPFCVGDSFVFQLNYAFSDYRGRYSAPDWRLYRSHCLRGRTPAKDLRPYYYIMLEPNEVH